MPKHRWPRALLAIALIPTACSTPASVSGGAPATQVAMAAISPGPSTPPSAAPRPSSPSAAPSATALGPSLFPFLDGATWTYDVIVNDQKVGQCTITCKVTQVSPVPTGDFRSDTVMPDANGSPRESISHAIYKAFPDQLLAEDADGNVFPELKLPLRVGASWILPTLVGNSTFNVVDQEPIETGVQEYQNAWRVAGKAPDGSGAISWYAEGVGRIRKEAIDPDGNVITWLLASFVP